MPRFLIPALLAAIVVPPAHAENPPRPGPTADGFLLPNGWRITPAGRQLQTADLPLNILPLSDGQHALMACSGFNRHELLLVDLNELKVLARETVFQSWFGLAATRAQD